MKAIKNIVLIEPGAPGFHVFSRFTLPRLGLPVLGAILRDLGYEVKIFCEDLLDSKKLSAAQWKKILEADLVGISTITCTADRAFDIIKQIKSNEPDKPVIIGGPHVTFLSDEALDMGADFVVRGEGERALVELLDWFEDKNEIENIAGLSYKIGSKHFHNSKDEFDQRVLDENPMPALELIEGIDKLKALPIQTSRGCPYGCEFCSVIHMFGRKPRYVPIERVLAEIVKLKKLFPKKSIFFYDDNFAINPKRTKKLLRKMIELAREKGLNLKWSAQIRVNATQDFELMDLMRRAGCNQVFVGIESINPKSLKSWHKKQTVEDIEQSIRVFHNYGMAIHGMFVFGSDEDDLNTIKQTLKFTRKNAIDTVMFSILVPLPGTPVFNRFEKDERLISRKWRDYDSHHVVFQPKKISPFLLQRAVMLRAMPKFYSWWRIFARTIKSFLPSKKLRSYSLRERLRVLFFSIYGHITIKKWRRQRPVKSFIKWLKKKSEMICQSRENDSFKAEY